jgi:hypothetical protein
VRELDDGRNVIGNEVIVVENDTSLVVSHLPRFSFAYEIPGIWGWGNGPGTIRRVDGSGMLGVMLYSEGDLARLPGATAFERAAAGAEESMLASVGSSGSERGHSLARTELKPLVTNRFEAATWLGESSPDAHGHIRRGEKVLLDIGSHWLVVVTPATPSRDTVLDRLIESLGTSSDSNGFWPLLQERYPEFVLQPANPAMEPSAPKAP